jgi:outer membrane protein OmpU
MPTSTAPVPPTPGETPFLADNIEQFSAMVEGSFAGISAKVTYTDASAGSIAPGDVAAFPAGLPGDDEFTTYGVGLGYSFGMIGVTGYYHKVDSAGGRLAPLDGADAYGAGFTYDLGGGATLAGGVARTFGRPFISDVATGATDVESATVADFGIRMAF